MPRSIDNDLAVGSNGMLMVPTQLEYVAQRARQRIRFILGESFRRPDEGIPYFTEPVIGSYLTPEMTAQFIANDLPDSVPEITDVRILEASLNRLTACAAVALQRGNDLWQRGIGRGGALVTCFSVTATKKAEWKESYRHLTASNLFSLLASHIAIGYISPHEAEEVVNWYLWRK